MDSEELKVEKMQTDYRNPTERIEGKSDLSNFQVVRREFSNHKFAANIGFDLSKDKITFNTACIKFYEDSNYIQILVDESTNRVAIRKCDQYDKDAMQWATYKKKDGKRIAKEIKTGITCARIYNMMGDWDENDRYKILGTRKIYEDADFVLFLLDEAEGFETTYEVNAEGKRIQKLNPYLPSKWKDSFGDYVDEHDRKQKEGMIETIKLFNTPNGDSYFVQPKTRPEDKRQ